MRDFTEELKYHKHEKDKIKAEINDLESRIFVESGRNNRFEVNNYRNRINRLKMRSDEINLKIVELEKMNKNQNQNKIQVMPTVDLNVPAVKNGEITVTDTIEFDCGSYDAPEIIQTVTKTVEEQSVIKTVNLFHIKKNTMKHQPLEDWEMRRIISLKFQLRINYQFFAIKFFSN